MIFLLNDFVPACFDHQGMACQSEFTNIADVFQRDKMLSPYCFYIVVCIRHGFFLQESSVKNILCDKIRCWTLQR